MAWSVNVAVTATPWGFRVTGDITSSQHWQQQPQQQQQQSDGGSGSERWRWRPDEGQEGWRASGGSSASGSQDRWWTNEWWHGWHGRQVNWQEHDEEHAQQKEDPLQAWWQEQEEEQHGDDAAHPAACTGVSARLAASGGGGGGSGKAAVDEVFLDDDGDNATKEGGSTHFMSEAEWMQLRREEISSLFGSGESEEEATSARSRSRGGRKARRRRRNNETNAEVCAQVLQALSLPALDVGSSSSFVPGQFIHLLKQESKSKEEGGHFQWRDHDGGDGDEGGGKGSSCAMRRVRWVPDVTDAKPDTQQIVSISE